MLSSIFYFLIFGIGGIVLPFFPIWLLDTGLSVAQIGYVLGIGTMLKVVSNPATMMIVDVTGRLRAVALALILIVWVCYAGLIKVTSFSYIIALYFAISCFFAPLMPLADRYSVYVTEKTGSAFGSKRLWGTVGFLLTSLGGGLIFNMWGVRPLPIVMLVLFAIMGVVALNMPKSIRTIGERSSLFDKTNPLIQVVSNSRLIGMITACALIQCSNAYLYSFSSVVWTEQYGFTAGVIALIWSVGLVAEIAMFTFADRLIHRFGIKTILLSASVVTMVRWGLLGSYTFLPTLVMAQLLQAFTLSLNISVLMRYIIENTSQNIKASAISLYMTLGIGLFLSLMILLTTGLGLGVDKSGFYVMIIPVFLAAVITISLNPSKRQSS